MTLKYTNNAQATLDGDISATATSLTVGAGLGDRFPAIAASDSNWFPLTLIKADGSAYEIVKATERVGDTITIVRGQENTPASIAFTTGDIVSHRMTSAAYDEFLKNGNTGVVLPQGLNVATQTNLVSAPYELELEGISELTDGLRIAFKPVVTNTAGSASIKLNDLDTKAILTQVVNGNPLLQLGDIRIDQHYEFQYSLDRDRWLMESPIFRDTLKASSLSDGTVELASDNSNDFVFDTGSNPASTSGAAKVFTRVGISKIIEDYHLNLPKPVISDNWRTYTDQAYTQAFNFTTANASFENGGEVDNVNTFSLANGEQLRAGNVNVVRANTSITIAGTLILSAMRKGYWPVSHIGPIGGEKPGASAGALPNWSDRQEMLNNGYFGVGLSSAGGAATVRAMKAAIRAGESMFHCHGGHGYGSVGEGSPDSFIKGRGGMILMAPSINISSTAKLFLPVRVSEDNNGYTELDGTGLTDPDNSAGGGGVLILVTDNLTISSTAEVKYHDPAAAYENYSVAKSTSVDSNVGSFAGAQSGKILHVNPSAETVTLLV